MPEFVATADGVDAASAYSGAGGGGCCPCGCGGSVHAVFDSEGGGNPFAALNADDRGGLGPNGKTSFTTTQAGAQIARSNLSWSTTGLGQPANVTFAFRSSAPTTLPTDTTGFARFNDAQISASLLSFSAWSDVANLTFTRVNDGDGYSNSATILLSNYTAGQDGSAAFAYQPGSTSSTSNAGDVWVNSGLSYNATPVLLGYGFQVLTHEIGHAIGLSHPAAYNAAPGVSITYANDAVYYEDSRQYTVMSYFSESNTGGNFNAPSGARQYSAAPLLDDIAAAQRLYGANLTTRTGDTIYGFNSTADRPWFSATSAATDLIFAVWDAGGNDTLDFSGYGDNQVIDLRQGAFSDVGGLTGNVAIAIGAVIENAVGGSGAERIFGNGAANRITGGAGNDTIDGGLGNDTVVFSGVRAAYTITYSGQTATITGPDGVDVLTNVETFQFADQSVAAQAPSGGVNLSGDVTDNVLNGTGFSDTLSGAGGNDILSGLGGDDSLNGGTGADSVSAGDGADTLTGGAGNDTLDGGAGIDTALFAGTSGTGVVVNLTTGSVSGGDGIDSITGVENLIGSVYADVLTGDAGANVISSGGGADTLFGGAGGDQLTASGAPGQGGGAPDIIKAIGTANDTTASAISLDGGFDLLTRSDVSNSGTIAHATVLATTHGGLEYYAFTAAAGVTITLDIDGASFDSTIRLFNAAGTEVASNDDNDADNGGERTDSLLSYTVTTGGTFYVQVGEWNTGSGSAFTTKAPTSGGSYALHVSVPNHAVVPVTLIGASLNGDEGNDTLTGGTGADTAFGGTGDDLIFGFAGNDGLLQGNQGEDTVDGGDGDDFVYGGQGNDIVYGQAGDDFVQGNLGNDTVLGGTGQDTLLGGQGNDTVSGEDGNDLIFGDLGNDTINGGNGVDTLQGGAGSDVLIGGAGIDIATYTRAVNLHYLEATAGGGWRIYDGASDVDTLSEVEWGQFGSAPIEALSVLAGKSFDSYGYILGYSDLLATYRNDPLGAYLQYVRTGQAEGRVADSFDGLSYIASYGDLIGALGTNGNAGSRHFVLNGQAEGRGITFSAANYLSVNADLRAAFGNDQEAATRHYIQFGFAEGRATGAPRSSLEVVDPKAGSEPGVDIAAAGSPDNHDQTNENVPPLAEAAPVVIETSPADGALADAQAAVSYGDYAVDFGPSVDDHEGPLNLNLDTVRWNPATDLIFG